MASKTRKILLLPGDGIGPEVIAEVKKILEWMNKTKSLDFVLSQELIVVHLLTQIKFLLLMRFFISLWSLMQ